MTTIKGKDTKRNMNLKIVIKNVKKVATVIDGSTSKKKSVVRSSIPGSKPSLELSEIIMTMPKEQVNLLLPKLPPKKRWFVLYRRMLTKAKPAASKITNDIPVSKRKYDFDDHDNQEYRARVPKVKRLKKGVPARTNTGPDLPEDYKQIILGRLKGKHLTMLIGKSLDDRDVKCDKSILTLPSYETLAKNFLEDIEMESLKRHTTLKVPLIDPKCLKWWKMSKEELYEPKSNWNEIVEQNGMVKGDKVQVWSFRANKDEKEDQLHLALVLVKGGENQKGDHNKSSQESDSTSEGSTVINQSEDSANARHMEIVKAER
uniref:B3 domain-containing protein At1g05920-like n=1 Tax=Fragaria vesca subsp. vesca TaxID=101020 RepID=UPI0005CA7BCA|nr:PREDICTED: B3 domain-containing protein At1g05920-like [Fragaria vesca subsp. vesca]